MENIATGPTPPIRGSGFADRSPRRRRKRTNNMPKCANIPVATNMHATYGAIQPGLDTTCSTVVFSVA